MSKFSQLNSLNPVDALDLLAVSDVSAGQSKKITAQDFMRSLAGIILPRNIDLRVADATAQAALTPVEGMKIYRQDLDKEVVYDGSAWRVLAGWEVLGSLTLSSAGDTISLPSLPARKNLRIFFDALATGGNLLPGLRFNNDSANNYSFQYSTNYAASAQVLNTPQIQSVCATVISGHHVGMVECVNVANRRKLLQGTALNDNDAGAGSSVNIIDSGMKWSNTSAQITRIDLINFSTGDFAIGSQLVVIGADFA